MLVKIVKFRLEGLPNVLASRPDLLCNWQAAILVSSCQLTLS